MGDAELGTPIQEKHTVGGSIVYLSNRKSWQGQEGKEVMVMWKKMRQ